MESMSDDSAEFVADLYVQRRKELGAVHAGMRQVKEIYDGEAVVPLPDMAEDQKAAVPNLLAQGVDQMAGRVASSMPIVGFASDGSRRNLRRAQTAQRVVQGWWQNDSLPLKQKQRARYLIAFGIAPAVVTLDAKTKLPTWHIRNPLHTYPSPHMIPGTQTPTDTLFAYRRSAGWLRMAGYGAQLRQVTNHYDDIHNDDLFTILEHVDEDHRMLCLSSHDLTITTAGRCVMLEYIPNPTGMPQAVVPQRIGLGHASGQFDSLVGMYYQQAKLMALEVMAVERGIFPDTYLVSRPGEQAKFVDGPYDGRSGMVNIVAGGDVKELTTQPGYMTPQTIDRLERSQRLTAGIPSEFGGESATNIRTGRRGDAVLSAVIDFPVAEAQEMLAAAIKDEDKIAIGLAKHYTGRTEKTLFVGTGNATRQVTYTPNEVFTTEEHVVTFPATGADVNQLMMGLGQRVGMGIMSKMTAATLDPFIDNAEFEHDKIVSEGLEQALLAGLQQQASAGAIPPMVIGKIMKLVETDKMELAEALNKAVEDAQKEAQSAQDAAEGEQPMQPTPEMAAAGPTAQSLSGNPDALSPVPGPQPAQQDIESLLTALRSGGRGVA